MVDADSSVCAPREQQACQGTLDHLAVDGRANKPCRCGRRDCLHVVASDIALG
jgi:predicted NBD/HSP70 family sugar kinase